MQATWCNAKTWADSQLFMHVKQNSREGDSPVVVLRDLCYEYDDVLRQDKLSFIDPLPTGFLVFPVLPCDWGEEVTLEGRGDSGWEGWLQREWLILTSGRRLNRLFWHTLNRSWACSRGRSQLRYRLTSYSTAPSAGSLGPWRKQSWPTPGMQHEGAQSWLGLI